MLPAGFTEKMERLPGLDAAAFFRALDGEAVRGLRINPAKCDALPAPSPFILRKITYVRSGYILEGCGVPVGQTPEHHAGMIYMQDPGAMCPVAAVNIEEGWRVADLCAAPGGKTSQLSAAVGEGGAVLSNEYVGKRARILVGNVERLGLRNVAVTSLDTSELAKLYPAFFDLVAADAPCSGEGMFRKCEDAVSDWSENNVRECAKRQAVILDAAAKMVKPGGLLLYSTCTYSPEEDEMTVSAFTDRHPEFSIIPVREEIRRVTAPGIRLPGVTTKNIEECRRFYPYLTPGEGQFLCLMRKDGSNKEYIARPEGRHRTGSRRIYTRKFRTRGNASCKSHGRYSLYTADGSVAPGKGAHVPRGDNRRIPLRRSPPASSAVLRLREPHAPARGAAAG